MADIIVGTTSLDEDPYRINWRQTDWGVATPYLPNVFETYEGPVTVAPQRIAYEARRGKLVGRIRGMHSYWDKQRQLTELAQTLTRGPDGTVKLYHGPKHLPDVWFSSPRAVDDVFKRLNTVLTWEADFLAVDPLWRLNQPLNNIQWGTDPALYWDSGIPFFEAQPPYAFTLAAEGDYPIQFDNWGTAYCYPVASITGTALEEVWFELDGDAERVKAVVADGLLEEDRFFVPPGVQSIRIYDAETGGNLVTGITVDFGATYLRFL